MGELRGPLAGLGPHGVLDGPPRYFSDPLLVALGLLLLHHLAQSKIRPPQAAVSIYSAAVRALGLAQVAHGLRSWCSRSGPSTSRSGRDAAAALLSSTRRPRGVAATASRIWRVHPRGVAATAPRRRRDRSTASPRPPRGVAATSPQENGFVESARGACVRNVGSELGKVVGEEVGGVDGAPVGLGVLVGALVGAVAPATFVEHR